MRRIASNWILIYIHLHQSRRNLIFVIVFDSVNSKSTIPDKKLLHDYNSTFKYGSSIGKYSGQEHPPPPPHPRVGGRNKLLPCFFKNREEISFDQKKFYMVKIKGFPSRTLHPIPHQKCLMFSSSFSKFLTKNPPPKT